MLSPQDGENFFNEFIFDIKKSKNSKCEDIGLLRFLEFCEKSVALEVNDRKILHKKYLEGLDAMIKVPESHINNLTIIRKIFNNCKDITEIKSIMHFIQNMGVEQIKEIKNTNQQKQKIETLEYYLTLKNGSPKWFINKLNELSKYHEQVLKYSLLDPFWCHIVDFGKEESYIPQIYIKLNIRPEHPTQCSYERKKLYHRPSFNDWPKNLEEAVTLFEKPEDDNLDVNDSVQETVVIINSNNNDPIYISNNKDKLKSLDTTKEQGVTLFRVYSRKVDTAVTYSPETDIKLYILIYEAKRLYISQRGDYNKLCKMLNDAANSFILYLVKKCKMVTNELKKLFSEMQWIGLFSSDGKIYFMIYQICEETKIHFITYQSSYPISIPIKHENHDIASALEIFLQVEDIFQMNLKVIEKIHKIADQINTNDTDPYKTAAQEYLTRVISETPSTLLK
ncbi:hypothetical protein C2G38_2191407 [Gigaspora rosea]|uniref:Uncharacterized protein n=1 Tax=Gigaspora rosea TaxID=44941 RepID=A0A397V1S9_9GLOM|nr:hypothetical protein C2G38_2191407 [Gigaspora rosea]